MTGMVPVDTAFRRGTPIASDMTSSMLAAVLVYSRTTLLSDEDGGIVDDQVSLIKALDLLMDQQEL